MKKANEINQPVWLVGKVREGEGIDIL